MGEREPFNLATIAAETMYSLWELEYRQEGLALDAMMMRLKDLSAYSLTHAEIMEQREGVELLALGMFFGASSNPAFRKNQERLQLLSDETVSYEGQADLIEQEIALRKAGGDNKGKGNTQDKEKSSQLRLL